MKRIVKFTLLILITLIIALVGTALAPPPVEAAKAKAPVKAPVPVLAAVPATVIHTFPNVNFGIYRTDLWLINPTMDPIPVPSIHYAMQLQPLEARKLEQFAGLGGGTFQVELPAAVRAYVEITHESGLILRVSDIGSALKYAVWMPTRNDADYATYIFIHAANGATTVSLRSWDPATDSFLGQTTYYLHAGEIIIPEIAMGATLADLKLYDGFGFENMPRADFRAFAFTTHRASHNMIPLTRYP